MNFIKLYENNHTQVIKTAVSILNKGGLIIYPTETCYGAGVDATNQKAVNKILAYKTFRQGKPMSVAVASQKMAANYVFLNPTAKNLYQKFLPGPLTVISKSKHQVADQVESSTNTLGIRIPDYSLIIEIIKRFNKPITATSANVSYKKRPYAIKDILTNTSKKQQNLIDLIIDAGVLPKRPPSTIVDTTLDDPLILRQGTLHPRGERSSQSLKPGLKEVPKPGLSASVQSRLERSSHLGGVITRSPQQTGNLAQTLMLKHWNNLQTRPLIFLLIGDLGSGKTQFAKGIGKFLKIKANITSPTYTLVKEYNYDYHHIPGIFFHLDTWRIQNIEELNQLNLLSYLKPKNVLAIEWADRAIQPLLELAKKAKAKIITVKLQTVSGSLPSHRRIIF